MPNSTTRILANCTCSQAASMSSSQRSPKPVRKNLLDKLDLKKPLHTGYMFKQSHIPPKVFNKRFFALYPKVLVYYDTESHFSKDVHTGTLAVRLHRAAVATCMRFLASIIWYNYFILPHSKLKHTQFK